MKGERWGKGRFFGGNRVLWDLHGLKVCKLFANDRDIEESL